MKKRCYDGYLVEQMDPIVFLMPYIMPRKTDSEVKITTEMDLDKVEVFIKAHKEDIPGLTLYHIVFASLVRACAVTPAINRFICKNRLYQRDQVKISMVIKKQLAIDGKETSIFPAFETSHTLKDIVEITQRVSDEALASLDSDSNDFDKLTGILYKIPPFVVSWFIKFMMLLDRQGKLPKSLVNMQPFHSGFFVTNVGSIGLPVIYHHLYEFGTTSCFLGMGKKKIIREVDSQGEIVTRKVIPMKFTLDSRICDGFTYSKALRTIKKCFDHPEWLLEAYKPEEV